MLPASMLVLARPFLRACAWVDKPLSPWLRASAGMFKIRREEAAQVLQVLLFFDSEP